MCVDRQETDRRIKQFKNEKIIGKFKKLQEDIENVTNKEVVKQTRISGVATIVLIISVACAIGGMSFEDPNSSMPTFLFTASALLFLSGVIKLLVDRSCYMFKPTKSKLKTMTMYSVSYTHLTLPTNSLV